MSKKINKKLLTILSVLCILFALLTTYSYAATVSADKTDLLLVENNVCTIDIMKGCVFEKKLTNYDLEKKELEFTLTVSNNNVRPLDKPSEIVIVIDNSSSMNRTISTGGSRMEAVTDSAKALASELLKLDTVKLSIVSFSAVYNGTYTYADPEYKPLGTMEDAKLIAPLTSSKETILNAITSIAHSQTGVQTNIEAGLTLAEQQFTGTCESKFVVLLTDGVPNLSLSSNNIQYSQATATSTINCLKRMDSKGIQILSMMTEVTGTEEQQTHTPYKDLAEEIFGTPRKPTVGKFYYITDSEINETVSKIILSQLLAPDTGLLTDLDINDYLTDEIISNFNFEYITEPTLGTANSKEDVMSNGLVKWHIDTLDYGESAKIVYKLTAKDEIQEEIIDKVIDTTKRVDITTDKVVNSNDEKVVITSNDTPKVKFETAKEPEPTPTPTPTPKPSPSPTPSKTPDTTKSEDPVPYTGVSLTVTLLLLLAGGYNVYALARYLKLDNTK